METEVPNTYVAYGHGIKSAIPLPELQIAAAPAEITILLGKAAGFRSKVEVQSRFFLASSTEVLLTWEDVGQFAIRNGSVVVEPAPGVEAEVLRLYLLGAVLGTVLHYRGQLILHASAVAMNGGAVVFLGDQGGGKSTTAAALYTRGYALVADDVTPIRFEHGIPITYPGYPRIKLWPEAAVKLGYSLETLPRIVFEDDKRSLHCPQGFNSTPLPVRRIYILSPEEAEDKIEPVNLRDALMELVRHSYCHKLLAATGFAAHFFQCNDLVKKIPIRRISSSKSLHSLPKLVKMIEDDLA